MKVMVTGATAPLGRALVAGLLARPDVEYVLAIGHERDALPSGERAGYLDVDLSRPRVVHDLLWGEAFDRGIDAIVHAM